MDFKIDEEVIEDDNTNSSPTDAANRNILFGIDKVIEAVKDDETVAKEILMG